MNFGNPAQASQFLNERLESGKTIAQQLGMRIATNRCMYEGQQWLSGYIDGNRSQTGRLYTNWNPESRRLVATVNRINKIVQECAAATFPDKMECDWSPGDRDTGIEAALRAQVLEAMANVLIQCSGYTEAARVANFRRCVDGTHLMGWGIRLQNREVALRNGGTEMQQDQVLRTFTADSTRLMLDPGNQSRELQDHDDVVYSEVWTVERARRDLGLTIDESDCATYGELFANELWYNTLSQGRLYTMIPTYSKTKAVRVHQVHIKDDSGRFGTMLVGVQMPKSKDITFINWENQETPFGGKGLPLMLLHGYLRPDSMWSASDAAMLKDDQDRLNHLYTVAGRMLQNTAGWQWIVSEESLNGADPDEYRNQYTNQVGGPIFFKQGSGDRQAAAPTLVKYPEPPAFLMQWGEKSETDMQEQAHRPDITSGGYKTHTADATYQTALRGANQVLGNRVSEDKARHEFLLGVGVGTMVKLAKAGSPTMLAELHRAGFDETDYQTIVTIDEKYPPGQLTIRDSSIKYQDPAQKEQRLWQAVQAQAIDASDLRMALAALDLPLGENDKAFYADAQRTATQVLLGLEWEGEMLGEYGVYYENAFRRSLSDPRAKDPETRARIRRAIQAQMVAGLATTQMQAAAEAPPQPQQPEAMPGQEAATQEEGPQEADLNSLLSAIEQGSTGGQAAA